VDYSLDAFGNRLSDGTSSRSYDAGDRVLGFSYDASGNLLDDGTTSYAYDAENRLVQTTRGGVITTYAYDGWGNLVRETVGGLTTDFVLDEQGGLTRVLGALRSDGLEELYAYGPEGVAAQRQVLNGAAQALHYPLLDAQGSLRHLTDAAGGLVLTRFYDAWGNLRWRDGAGDSRLGYTGELQSGDLVYLRARWYNTRLGTFTSRDSFEGFSERPQSLHRTLYAEGNPVNHTDPSGQAVDDHGHWQPCNLLPGRDDTCTFKDYQEWWGSDDGDKFRRMGWTIGHDVVDGTIFGLPKGLYHLVTNPGGALEGLLRAPVDVVENILFGTICGNPEQIGHGLTGYAFFAVGGSFAKAPVPPVVAADAEIQIIGFQGAGRDYLKELGDPHPLTYAGHVGISFDGGKTIFGFTPHTPGKSGSKVLQELKEHRIFPGKVGNDTGVFHHAYQYAQELIRRNEIPDPPRLDIYIWRQRVSRQEFERIQQMVMDEMNKSPLHDKLYGFPKNKDVECYNCAQWPGTIGVEIPEPTGQLRDYIPMLIQRGGGERWTPME
jgi:RHS repeat-associated protein